LHPGLPSTQHKVLRDRPPTGLRPGPSSPAHRDAPPSRVARRKPSRHTVAGNDRGPRATKKGRGRRSANGLVEERTVNSHAHGAITTRLWNRMPRDPERTTNW